MEKPEEYDITDLGPHYKAMNDKSRFYLELDRFSKYVESS